MSETMQTVSKPKIFSKEWFKIPKNIGITCAIAAIAVAAVIGGIVVGGGEENIAKYEYGQTATLNSMEYTVDYVMEVEAFATPDRPGGSSYYESGVKWATIVLKVKNLKSYSATLSYTNFHFVTENNTSYAADIGSYTWYVGGNGATFAGAEKICYTNSLVTVNSGFSKDLLIFFKIPTDTKIPLAYVMIKDGFNKVGMLLNN